MLYQCLSCILHNCTLTGDANKGFQHDVFDNDGSDNLYVE